MSNPYDPTVPDRDGAAYPPQQPASSRLAWWSLGLMAGGVLFFALQFVPGLGVVPLTAPLMIAGIVVAIIALRRRSQPRWAPLTVLIVGGAGLLVWAVFAIYTLVMFVTYIVSVA